MSSVSSVFNPELYALEACSFNPTCFHHLAPQNHSFKGRKKELDAIDNALTKYHIVQLVGFPKTGKTTIETEFFHRNFETRNFNYYFKLNGETEDSLKKDLCACVQQLFWLKERGITEIDIKKLKTPQLLEIAKIVIEKIPTSLFVFDNVSFSSIQSLTSFLPAFSHNSDILITSREQLFENIPCVVVEKYTEEDAIDLLSNSFENEARENLLALAKALDFSPEKLHSLLPSMLPPTLTCTDFLQLLKDGLSWQEILRCF